MLACGKSEDIMMSCETLDRVYKRLIWSLTTLGRRHILFFATIFILITPVWTAASNDVDLNSLGSPIGYRIIGAVAGSKSGHSVSAAGDVDNDNIGDVIVGAPEVGGGIAYVVFGRAKGMGATAYDDLPLLTTAFPSNVGFRILGAATGDMCGSSVSAAGDVNHDGIDDIIIGAYGADPFTLAAGSNAGMAYVIFGRDIPGGADPFTDIQLTTSSTPMEASIGFRILGAWVSDNVGYSVASAGDINGDAISDVMIGSTNALAGAGVTYVILGQDLVTSGNQFGDVFLADLNSNPDFGFHIFGDSGNSGTSLSPAGDVNGDGIGDIIIGAPAASAGISLSGISYVVFGRIPPTYTQFGNLLLPATTMDNAVGFRIIGAASDEATGWSVSAAGDINGDNLADVLIGSNYIGLSRAYVVFGRNLPAGATPFGDIQLLTTTLPASVGFRLLGPVTGDKTGFSVSSAGDINGDEFDDLLVGAYQGTPASKANAGIIYVVFGRLFYPNDGTPFGDVVLTTGATTMSPTVGFRILGAVTSFQTGFSVKAAGDINGDGAADVIVGAPFANPPSGSFAGTSYVICGTAPIKPTSRPSSQPSRQPSSQPSMQPSMQPMALPSAQPSDQPSTQPSSQPLSEPSGKPSSQPSSQPTSQPNIRPTAVPSGQPSSQPTTVPSRQPSTQPTLQPSNQPSAQPSDQPFAQPSRQPSTQPTLQPSSQPSAQPSRQPSAQPTLQPSIQPSAQPSRQPSAQPTFQPSSQPSAQPSGQPTSQPNIRPTAVPSGQPSSQPTTQPSVRPTVQPSVEPSTQPSRQPSRQPSVQPTLQPSNQPSAQPSRQPSAQPTLQPSSQPSARPSRQPSAQPTFPPSCQHSAQPSRQPSTQPTLQPSAQPSVQPSSQPSAQPSRQPSAQPSVQPSSQPSAQSSRQPSAQPTFQPSAQPSRQPSSQPSGSPSTQPSVQPSRSPSVQPSSQPSTLPSGQPTSQPSLQPNAQPTFVPSTQPCSAPTNQPTVQPSEQPSAKPSSAPTTQPSDRPSGQPSTQPSVQPLGYPSVQPTSVPSSQPSAQPSDVPSSQPTRWPTAQPSSQPIGLPSSLPSSRPTLRPTAQPSGTPVSQPTSQPSAQPSGQPTNLPSGRPIAHPSALPTTQPSDSPSTQPTQQPSAQPSGEPSLQPVAAPSAGPSAMPTVRPSNLQAAQEFVLLVPLHNDFSWSDVAFVEHNSWGCGQSLGKASCVTVDSRGKRHAQYILPWSEVSSILPGTKQKSVILSGGTLSPNVLTAEVAKCSIGVRQLSCQAAKSFQDAVFTSGAVVSSVNKVVYTGSKSERASVAVLDDSIAMLNSYVYSSSTVQTINLLHARSPPDFIGVFVAGSGVTAASITYVLAGMVRSDSGFMTAMHLSPSSGSILNRAELVNAMALEYLGPDTFIAGGLRVTGQESVHAYVLRVNSLYISVQYGRRYRLNLSVLNRRRVLSGSELLSSEVTALVLADPFMYLLINWRMVTEEKELHQMSLLKTSMASGAILRQVHILSPDASLSCADMAAAEMFLTIACSVLFPSNNSHALLLSVDRELTFSKLPDGFVRSEMDVFTMENFPFQRKMLPLSTQKVDSNPIDNAFNTTDGNPTTSPSLSPTSQPSAQPSSAPSGQPSSAPSATPSVSPQPSSQPSTSGPTITHKPTVKPSSRPTAAPSMAPTLSPSRCPSVTPTVRPTVPPSRSPSVHPSIKPTSKPTRAPQSRPTIQPTVTPSAAFTSAGTNTGVSTNTREAVSDVVLVTGGSIVGGLLLLWAGYKLMQWCTHWMKARQKRKIIFEQIVAHSRLQLAQLKQSLRESIDREKANRSMGSSVVLSSLHSSEKSYHDGEWSQDVSLVGSTNFAAQGAYAIGLARNYSESDRTNQRTPVLTSNREYNVGSDEESSENSIVLSSLHSSERSSYDAFNTKDNKKDFRANSEHSFLVQNSLSGHEQDSSFHFQQPRTKEGSKERGIKEGSAACSSAEIDGVETDSDDNFSISSASDDSF